MIPEEERRMRAVLDRLKEVEGRIASINARLEKLGVAVPGAGGAGGHGGAGGTGGRSAEGNPGGQGEPGEPGEPGKPGTFQDGEES